MIIIINGSIRGKQGNSFKLASLAQEQLNRQHEMNAVVLNLSAPKPRVSEVYELLKDASGFLVISGTYWNSWSSSLQRFIEVMTAFENTPAFFGKPMACAVTADSVGGSEVAGRLQSAFTGLGCWIPPCSKLVLTRVGQEAIAASKSEANEDVWRIDDLDIVLKNLVAAANITNAQWTSWPHVQLNIEDGEWPEWGDLDLGTPKFI